MVPELISDTIIFLDIQHIQLARQRTIEILKSRGQDYLLGSHSFSILEGKGVEVYGRVQTRRFIELEHAAASDPKTRVTTAFQA